MPLLDKLYYKISGKELFELSEDSSEPLVEGILYRNDYIMLTAQPKVGKTIFMQQLTACMTSGNKFLGVFEIPKPLTVWYFATEGRAEALKDRFIRINKRNPIDTSRLLFFPTFFRFNTEIGVNCLEKIVNDNLDKNPDVIIIDALYHGFKGSLKDDEAVINFHDLMGMLIEKLNCSIILVHHLRKPSKDEKGREIRQSSKDSYGSAFFEAGLDHQFFLDKWRDKDCPNDRVLKCDTQRSGNIIDDTRIRLRAPDPLYFEIVSKHLEGKNRVVKILHSTESGYDIDDIMSHARIGRSNAYTIVGELLEEKMVEKNNNGSRKIFYRLTGKT